MALVMYGLYDRRLGTRWPSEPFYIGIGTPKRPKRQLYDLRKGQHPNEDVQKVYDRHVLQGLEPDVRVLAVLPDWGYAAEVEKRAIRVFGRRTRAGERGCLCNLAGGGQGPDPVLMRTPAVAARNAAAQRRSYAENPHRRTQASAGGKKAARSVQAAVIRSTASKVMNARTWADPEVRQRRIANMRGVKKTASEVSLRQRRDALEKANAARQINGGSRSSALVRS